MNKRELEAIKDLCKDLERLKKQLQHIDIPIVTGSVKGSSPVFPYIAHTIMICGIEDKTFDKAVKNLKRDIAGKIADIMHKITLANAYIDAVPDADTRIILQAKFINGLNFDRIEQEYGIPHTTAHRKYRKWESGIEWDKTT